jgi:GST-like protein
VARLGTQGAKRDGHLGAILIYLAEKTGKCLPKDEPARYDVMQWLMWQMGGVGSMSGQANYFRNHAKDKIEYAINRYTDEVNRLYGVLDKRLRDREFMAGAYSIADMATIRGSSATPTSARRSTTSPT